MSESLRLLRREVREHRSALIALLALVASGTAGMAVAGEGLGVAVGADPWVAAALGSAAAVLLIGSAVLGQDASGGGVRFLARLPVRPWRVLASKLVFLSASVVGVAAFGFGAATALQGPQVKDPVGPSSTLDGLAVVASPLLFVGWQLLASCLAPSLAAAIPTAVVLAVVVVGPVAWALSGPYVTVLETTSLGLACWGVLLPWIAVVASWCGPLGRYGDRAGGSRRALLVLAVCVLPIWAWSGWKRAEATCIDPADDDVVIGSARLSTDGTKAYLTVQRLGERLCRAIVVDLSTGDRRRVGGVEAGFVGAAECAGTAAPDGCGPDDFVVLVDGGRFSLWDANAGRPGMTVAAGARLVEAASERIRAALQAASPYRDPEGRILYAMDGRLERARSVDDFEVVPGGPAAKCAVRTTPRGALTFLPIAAGPWIPRAEAIFDLATGGFRPSNDKALEAEASVGTGLLFRSREPDAEARPYVITSYDGATTRPASGLAADDEIGAALGGTRLLVRRSKERPATVAEPATAAGSLRIVDVETGETRLVADEAGIPIDGVAGFRSDRFRPPETRRPDGTLIFELRRGGVVRLARLQIATGVLSIAGGETAPDGDSVAFAPNRIRVIPLAIDGDEAVVLAEGRRLSRVRFGSSVRTELFPKF